MNNIKKELPHTGTDDFKKLIDGDYPFIDKTLFIKEFINNNSEVTLIPRPRRFGKTINVSMLTYFLDINKDSKRLFTKFKISKDSESLKHMNQHPVISITLKGIDSDNWSLAQIGLSEKMFELYDKYEDEVKDILNKREEKYYKKILNQEGNLVDLAYSLLKLSSYLERKYGKKVIIIIDEYDAVMHDMYGKDGFESCINFFRSMYSNTFKGNGSLNKGLLTGILRVAKEGIFSGLNNVDVFTVLDKEFSEYFGFLEEEIKPLLEREKIDLEKTKEWYNGYKIGEQMVYNPWSVLKLLKSKNHEVYWQNTGLGNLNLIMKSLKVHKGIVKRELKQLLEKKEVIAEIVQGINLQDIERDEASFFSLLFFSGYLTYIEKVDINAYKVKIPNREIESFYIEILRKIRSEVSTQNIIKDLIDGNIEEFEQNFNNIVLKGTSYYDSPESFYHGMVYIMAKTLKGYEVLSNTESGIGRADVLLRNDKLGMVIEVKRVKIEDDKKKINEIEVKKELEKIAQKALAQIREKRYYERLERDNIKLVGIAFKDKRCKVLMEDL